MANIKVKGPVNSVKQLLSGGVDTFHGPSSAESKRKVKQSQAVANKPKPSGEYGGNAYARKWMLSQQPQSGE
jgi:hypothetical protein